MNLGKPVHRQILTRWGQKYDYDAIEFSVYVQLRDQVRNPIYDQVWVQINDQVLDQLYEDLSHEGISIR